MLCLVCLISNVYIFHAVPLIGLWSVFTSFPMHFQYFFLACMMLCMLFLLFYSTSSTELLVQPFWTYFSLTRFLVEQCLLKKTIIWPLLTVWKLPGHHIGPNTADTRQWCPAKNLFPPELFHIGIVCLLLWSIPSPQRSLGHPLFKQKFSQKLLSLSKFQN